MLDRNTDGPKPGLIRDLGGTHHATRESLHALHFDIVMECTAAPALIVEFDRSLRAVRVSFACSAYRPEDRTPNSTSEASTASWCLATKWCSAPSTQIVSHYSQAATALAGANREWLDRLITRRVPLSRWHEAFTPRHDDIKVVLEFS